MCSQTLVFYEGILYRSFLLGVVLVSTWVSAIIIGYVIPISLLHPFCLQTFKRLLMFVFYEDSSYVALEFGVVLVHIWVRLTIIGYVRLI